MVVISAFSPRLGERRNLDMGVRGPDAREEVLPYLHLW